MDEWETGEGAAVTGTVAAKVDQAITVWVAIDRGCSEAYDQEKSGSGRSCGGITIRAEPDGGDSR